MLVSIDNAIKTKEIKTKKHIYTPSLLLSSNTLKDNNAFIISLLPYTLSVYSPGHARTPHPFT